MSLRHQKTPRYSITMTSTAPDPNPEPIAICGMGFRLPGGLHTPDDMYTFLASGSDARSPPDEARYAASSFRYKTPDGNRIPLPEEGYWLDWREVTGLDPSLFPAGSSRVEAEKLDPQQRILLRVAWEALESAGETDWRGREDVGCYVGGFGDDWRELRSRDALDPAGHKLTGYTDFALSNRISSVFDLRGPSMTVRVACSASGLALHLACQAIRAGECNAALVAGSNLIMSPDFGLFLAEQGVLSPEASCRTFGARANGYARGEAVSCLFIKRRDLAIRDGNPIRALVRGSATNCNGRTAGMATPSSEAQEALIRSAYRMAGIKDPSETAMVECHGTGTAVGDAVETCAIARVFGDKGVIIGSTKPALGHSEGASTLTSVIKAILSLERRVILPNIKLESPSLRIPFKSGRLVVPTEPRPWPTDRLERISINSFGIGGTNVHIILDSAASAQSGEYASQTHTESPLTPPLSPTTSRKKTTATLLVFSAGHEESLRKTAEDLTSYQKRQPDRLADLSYTLACRRVHHPLRSFLVVDEHGSIHPPATSSCIRCPGAAAGVAFIFTGQGASWARMGVDLLKSDPAFLQDIRSMDAVLKGLSRETRPTWTIQGELVKAVATSRLDRAEFSQPVSAALQIALARRLRRHGVTPGAVVGHSSGEIAAAYAAGALSLEDAIVTAYYRGYVCREITGAKGGMLAVGLGREKVSPYLVPDVGIACDNSSSSVTLSGPSESLYQVAENIRTGAPDALVRLLKVDKAYHSDYMAAAAEGYFSLLRPVLRPKTPSTPFYSTVCGRLLRDASDFGPAHWRDNMVKPVFFRQAVRELSSSCPVSLHLEIGPHPALAGPLKQISSETGVSTPHVAIMSRGASALTTFLAALGELHSLGVPIDLPVPDDARVLADLPPYPWTFSETCWPESRVSRAWRMRSFPPHELLGVRSAEAGDAAPMWRSLISPEAVPWTKDHRLAGDIVFPAAGYVSMVGEMILQLTGRRSSYTIRELSITTALILEPGLTVEVMSVVTDEPSEWRSFSIKSFKDGAWTTHCTGLVRPGKASTAPTFNDPEESFLRGVDTETWYRALARVGNGYGPEFRGIRDVYASVTSPSAKLSVESNRAETDGMHPTTLDVIFQSLLVAAHSGHPRLVRRLHVPTYIDEIFVDGEVRRGDILHVQGAATTTCAGRKNRGDLIARSSDGDPVVFARGFTLSLSAASNPDPNPHGAIQMVWKPDLDLLPASSILQPATNCQAEHEKTQTLLERFSLICAITIRDAATESIRDATPPHFEKLLAWVETYISRRTHQAGKTLSSVVARDQEMVELHDALQRTSARDAATLMLRCASHAEYLLSGTATPLELFLQDGALQALYDWMNFPWGGYAQLVGLLSHKRGNHLKVLEIGAGTGGLTARVLPHLKDGDARVRGTYVFTDVSAGFFPGARERFRECGAGMEYRVLDIGRDPDGQGFGGERFDLIIASNVLHVTPDVGATLANVRKLLKPDGRLLMQELACETKWINLIMGFLPGWWLGAPDNRAEEPYMTPETWCHRLLGADFSPPEAVVLDAEPPYQVNATIIARPAPAKITTTNQPQQQKQHVTLLCDKTTATAFSCLQELLQSSGWEVTHTPLGEKPPAPGPVISLLDLSPGGSFFHSPTAESLSSLSPLLESLKASDSPLLWLTRASQIRPADPNHAQVLGVARAARQELGVRFATLEMEESLDPKSMANVIRVLLAKLDRPRGQDAVDKDMEFVYRSSTGEVLIPRASWLSVPDALVLENRSAEDATVKSLHIARPGQLDTLSWTLRPPPATPGANTVQVRIHSAGLNFKDVLVAMGVESVLDDDQETLPLGLEASGVVTATGPSVSRVATGDSVMLLAPRAGCFSTSLTIPETLCVRIPPGISLGTAAGIPCIFATALRALAHKANLQPSQTVLIHSAAGGVGLAAIQVARHLGAGAIFATAGTAAKRAFLRDVAGINPSQIFSSRDDGFVDGVMRVTTGRGVDAVLNSLSGELLHASWRCVAPGGTFVDIGKRDARARSNSKLRMEAMDDNRTFASIDMSRLADRDISRVLDEVVDLLRLGAITPVEPSQNFPCDDVAEAFRCLARGTQIGKIIVDFADEHRLAPVPQPPDPTFRPDRVYIIVGGIAGLGASIVRWLAHHGARSIAILSRSAGKSPHDAAILAELRGGGCAVRAYACDVTDVAGVCAVLGGISRSQRVGGVVNLAMVLADVELSRLTPKEWHAATGPKVAGTWNLHRALDGGEDFFVLVGSMFGVTGRAGQANYAAANAFLDSFAQYRRGLGLPCSVLDVGPVEDVGTFTRKRGLRGAMGSAGARFLTEQDVLDGLQLAIARSRADVTATDGCPFKSEVQLGIGFRCTLPLGDPQNSVVWKHDPRMVFYTHVDHRSDETPGGRDAAGGPTSALSDFVSRVRDAPAELDTPASALFLGREIARRVLASLIVADDDGSRADASVSMSLASLGMDSLMTIEVRNWWRAAFGVDVNLLQLTSAPSFEHLGKLAARHMKERFSSGTG
ncbi:polyketide synthase [Colletotrichum musicola]|uniref:Polyketide synthase n=1 Tax=Colletotrichum musicola TaxID=2175873 RepID=A0A8H6KM81_9PEZI|nr:polyketide synthase [Colletotrichum musicola]